MITKEELLKDMETLIALREKYYEIASEQMELSSVRQNVQPKVAKMALCDARLGLNVALHAMEMALDTVKFE